MIKSNSEGRRERERAEGKRMSEEGVLPECLRSRQNRDYPIRLSYCRKELRGTK